MLRIISGWPRVADRLAYRLPADRRARVLRRLREREFNRFVERRIGPSYRPVPLGPVPAPELVGQTSAMLPEDAAVAAAPDEYFGGAYLGVLLFLNLLERNGFNLRNVGSVFELGCGSGKLIRLFRCIGGARLVGSDVNPAQIEWAQAHVPGVEFHVNELAPPLAFAAGDEFDLAYAASVFTHIPLDAQEGWIAEIARVVRPGGYFLCTLAGNAHAARQLSTKQREQLERDGSFTLSPDDEGASYATQQTQQCDVFQTRRAVIDAFAPYWEIRDYVTDPTGQDNLVLRKPRG
ncbi:Methyltransferase domain [Gaiella occulta]|uniref:Methyltransferase domain n=1 Tax=Gaiella occulta TaxID=1002870 RepID=A0A7M2YXI4_9ACTN|nr:class I SAM-dependent methyltransferase [Gaiella occulta]RDI74842.1 Methyltransferase domain [Gaiella occulta]